MYIHCMCYGMYIVCAIREYTLTDASDSIKIQFITSFTCAVVTPRCIGAASEGTRISTFKAFINV